MSHVELHPQATPPAEPFTTGNSSSDAKSTHSRKPGWGRWWWLLLLAMAFAAGAWYFHQRQVAPNQAGSAPASSGKRGGAGARISVVTADAVQGDISEDLTALGNVTPLNSVTVKTQVNGQLMKVLFTEGQMVREGDPLVEIDPRPYQVQLAQAKALLEHDQATLDNDQIDLKRYQKLWAQNSIPQQQLATQESLVRQDEGTVASDQAQVNSAQLNLTYCHITAPFSGRAGLRLVDAGNYVQTGDTSGLLVVNQVQPITVVFSVPEDDVPRLMATLKATPSPKVEAYDRSQKNKLAEGTLQATDNQIDPSTGMLTLKAQFANEKNKLFPNQFVNVRLVLSTRHNVTLVPASAVQLGADGSFVWIYDEDERSVSMQNVTVGATQDNKTEILSGVEPEDTVVTAGVDKLENGTHVSAQEAKP